MNVAGNARQLINSGMSLFESSRVAADESNIQSASALCTEYWGSDRLDSYNRQRGGDYDQGKFD